MRTKTCEVEELEYVKSVKHATFALMMNGNVGTDFYIKKFVITLHNYYANELKTTHPRWLLSFNF